MNLAQELRRLERLGPVLDALPGPAYLVGGTVRDLVLGRPPRFDVDIAVVGDGEAFARELARRIGGSVLVHERFGTATVSDGAGGRVDVATARTETYAAPGRLPDVAAAASIEEDLGRRDFTINSMAVSLPDGELVDPFSGRQHLADRLVRVLHERSFVDDPTRILRGARYEARLGFRMDPKTETLALRSIAALRDLSGARVREELDAVFGEDDVDRVLARLHELGVDTALGVAFGAPGLVGRLRDISERHRLGLSPAHLGFLSVDAPPGRLEELGVAAREAAAIDAAHREAEPLRGRVASASSPAAIVEEVERAGPGPDTALYALALGDLPELRTYFERLREVRLDLDGDDLAALGLGESPRVGEVLAELRRRKLNGDLGDRASELAAARELIAE